MKYIRYIVKKMGIVNFLLLILIMLTLTFSACGSGAIKIEAYEWKMRSIIHVDDDQIVYDATEEELGSHPDTKIIEMILVAKDGKITITDITNDIKYEGTYTVSGKTPESTDYHIKIDKISGYATVAMTTYADGTEEPTLPISIDGYTMYFYAK